MLTRSRYGILSLLLSLSCVFAAARAEKLQNSALPDTDADGISDALEQRLLVQFAPSFKIAAHDCAGVPAEFEPGTAKPTVREQNSTIYGQVSRAQSFTTKNPELEIRYFHLWATDCGKHGHPLDAEHVSVLVAASQSDMEAATWKAVYWYAAAHENTVCDVSQIARASTLGPDDKGVPVWISPGKHASYFSETLCHAGCGADRCEAMTPLTITAVINLGEPGKPMQGAAFLSSPQWPLATKMGATNFPEPSVARLELMPDSDIAWANPGRHPAQGIIADSSVVADAIAESGHNTTDAVSGASDSTGNALSTSARKTKHALSKSAKNVGKALGIKPSSNQARKQQSQ